MEIIQVNIDDLKPYENNPRNNEKSVKFVANSIKEFGFQNPIIINEDNVVLAGHTRIKAAQKCKMKQVPCIIAHDLDDAKQKAFRLADNKVAEFSEWDFELLTEELAELDSELDMADFGFEPIEEDEDEPIIDEEEDPFEDIEKLESHYGVPYQGNKSRIADIIVSILPAGERLVDLFGGGGGDNPLCYAQRKMALLFI